MPAWRLRRWSAGSSPSRTSPAWNGPASRPSTPPRTSTSPGSCATSWRSSEPAPSGPCSPRAAPPSTAPRERRRGRHRRAPARARPDGRSERAEPAREHHDRRPRADGRPARRALPSRPRRGGSRSCDRGHRPPGRRQVDAALGVAAGVALAGAHGGDARRGPKLAALRRLGGRASIDFDPADSGVLIRSTAAGERLGGIAWATRAAAHALAAAFDIVVIETVGVGQAETEIADVADTVAVVVQPGGGDVLQFLKSGIMEIPDVLVVTKSDLGQ